MLQKNLTILIADDDNGDREQIKRVLKQADLSCTFTEAPSIAAALEAFERCSFDCAIVDYRLNDQDGLAGISALHERSPIHGDYYGDWPG